MFGSKKRLARKLEQGGGQRASATVLKIENSWQRGTGSGQQWSYSKITMHMKLRLRVEPDGQPAFETSVQASFPGRFPLEGSKVQVLFDPDDHSKLTVDAPQEVDAPQAMASAESRAKVLLEQRSANLEAPGPSAAAPHVASPSDPADEISKLADLHDRGALTDGEFEAQKKKILGT
jgi:hypothetical protein